MRIAAGRFQIIRQVLENQALIESPEGRRQFSKIIRRSDNQSIRLSYRIQNRRESILADAVPFELLPLASEAGNTSCVLLPAEKVKLLNRRPLRLSSFYCFIDQCIRIPPDAGPAFTATSDFPIPLILSFI